jgi:hypothetical protein
MRDTWDTAVLDSLFEPMTQCNVPHVDFGNIELAAMRRGEDDGQIT